MRMLAYTDVSHFGAFLLHLWAFITKNSFVANTHLGSKYALLRTFDSLCKKGQE